MVFTSWMTPCPVVTDTDSTFRSITYGIYKLNDYTQELADQHTANERNPGEFSISYYKELFEQIKVKGNDDEI